MDDLYVCPMRAHFSLNNVTAYLGYSKGGMEFQKKALSYLRSLTNGFFIKRYWDPGTRGQRTDGEPLRVCALLNIDGERSAELCGRPDFVGLSLDPPSAFIVEIQQTSLWKSALKRTLRRLNFYAQGIHELFGLPISLNLFTPNEMASVIAEKDTLTQALDELIKIYQDVKYAESKAEKVNVERCLNCKYRKYCPVGMKKLRLL